MLRFIYMIATSIVSACVAIYRLSHVASDEGLCEEERYAEAIRTIELIKKKGRITTIANGMHNLPDSGGYIMYSNHQGKYDALGIMYSHKKPMSVLMDFKKSKVILTNQFIDALKGKRIKPHDPRQQIRILNEIAQEVNEGRRYLIFPEGGYTDNHNRLQNFSTGCFRSAMKAKCPIVPICIIDSWKPFGENSLRPVTTYVHFLKPIEYAEFCNMRASEIGMLVKGRSAEKLIEITGEC